MRIVEIEISGFGKFRNRFGLKFGDAPVQIISGSNEAGKTTLMNAIIAILFGVNTADKSKIIPWGSENASSGSLILEKGKRSVLIERDFVTDMVGCVVYLNGKQADVFSFRDKPGMRSERQYLKVLSEYVPLYDPSIYRQTTFIGHDDLKISLSENIKRYVTGSREYDYDAILEELCQEYFELTRDGKPINRTGKAKDQAIELLNARLEERQITRDSIMQSTQSQEELRIEIRNLQSRLDQALRTVEQLSENVERLENYIKLRREWDRLREVHDEFSEQRTGIEQLEEQITGIRQQIDEQYAVLTRIPIQQLRNDVRAWREAQKTQHAIEKELRRLAEERENLRSTIETEFKPYTNTNGRLMTDLQRLQDLNSQVDNKKRALLNWQSALEDQISHLKKYRIVSAAAAVLTSAVSGVGMFLTLGAMLPVFATALLTVFVIWYLANRIFIVPERRESAHSEAQIRIIQVELRRLRQEVEELEEYYSEIPNLSHFEEHSYRIKKLDGVRTHERDLATRQQILVQQLERVESTTDLETIRNRYEGKINLDNPDVESDIDRLHHLQEELRMREQALKLQKGKRQLYTRADELYHRIQTLEQKMDAMRSDHVLLNQIAEDEDDPIDRLKRLAAELENANTDQLRLTAELNEKRIKLARIEGKDTVDPESLDEEIDQLESELGKLMLQRDALIIAIKTLEKSIQNYFSMNKSGLAERLNNYLDKIVPNNPLFVEILDGFDIEIYYDNHKINTSELSQGTRDQLFFALRLAFADEMGQDARLPFLFDDPFVNCDDERLQNINQIVKKLAENHQVLIFSFDQRYREWDADHHLLSGITK
jgi:DNA repair exonuclease SbcCD ATPase subunit